MLTGGYVDRTNRLAGCLVHNGTVIGPRDIIRALETIEALTYVQTVDGEQIASGRATLVKIMAEPGSSTILVNGCLFLNVLSFRYLTFETAEDGACSFELVGDGMTLEIVPVDEEEESAAPANPRAVRLLEGEAFDAESYVVLDDEDDEDGR
jgi:hypothetical protein